MLLMDWILIPDLCLFFLHFIFVSMNILCWNCFGACKKGFRRAIRYLCNQPKVDIFALFETRVLGERVDAICNRMLFDGCVRVEAMGFAGGIWLLWKKERVDLSVVNSNRNFIHAIWGSNGQRFHLFFVYGQPTVSRQEVFWKELREDVVVC